ncbi:MAG TPA: diaminobutyrate--2-oxoglutarate transaminase [Dongiaceae bacterium]|nr:diaminobutyrate--2-oxoglutarate transaminase [Dongiaceae bacterium]
MNTASDVIDQYESNVRSYVRSFPVSFSKAEGSYIWDEAGRRYIDFFAGAGALNYGHNEPTMVQALIEYLQSNGIIHGLDMATSAKAAFIKEFTTSILIPRGLDYKLQFTGPTGTNGVEAALKIARLATGRHNVIAFSHSFHGVSLGSLAATANAWFRGASGLPLNGTTFLPYDGYVDELDSIAYLEKVLDDPSSGVDQPAAIIVELVQGEGGVNVASAEWAKRLRDLTAERGIILIVDDIQAGCGRTGEFFSFEFTEIQPDIVVLSKSISGIGLPMSLVLLKPELDIWKPGQHNGTFRGNNLAFVAGLKALETFWQSNKLSADIKHKEVILRKRLEHIKEAYPDAFTAVRGRGLLYGLVCREAEMAKRITQRCFNEELIIETAGAKDEVIKFIPALTISEATITEGLALLEKAIASTLNS